MIDGEQVRGDVSSTLRETVAASEREASDLIHRDRIPRQYHKAIRGYFTNLKETRGSSKKDANGDAKPSAGAASDGE